MGLLLALNSDRVLYLVLLILALGSGAFLGSF